MESDSGENSEININLKVIGQINEGDKLFVSQNLLQIDRSQRGIANASVRWYNNESRQQTMIQLNKIIRKAFQHMRTDKLISQNLETSLKGLIELKKTYIDDPTVVAQIDVLMEEIRSKHTDIENSKLQSGSSGNGSSGNGSSGNGSSANGSSANGSSDNGSSGNGSSDNNNHNNHNNNVSRKGSKKNI